MSLWFPCLNSSQLQIDVYKRQCKYRDELHKNAEYSNALEIATMIKKCNKKNITDYDIEDCQNQFVLRCV